MYASTIAAMEVATASYGTKDCLKKNSIQTSLGISINEMVQIRVGGRLGRLQVMIRLPHFSQPTRVWTRRMRGRTNKGVPVQADAETTTVTCHAQIGDKTSMAQSSLYLFIVKLNTASITPRRSCHPCIRPGGRFLRSSVSTPATSWDETCDGSVSQRDVG